jgi:hypothetical protein
MNRVGPANVGNVLPELAVLLDNQYSQDTFDAQYVSGNS